MEKHLNLSNIKRKLYESNIKIPTIISRCEKIDRNNDGYVHIDDFEDILDNFSKKSSLSRRDRNQIISFCDYDKLTGLINYSKLEELNPSFNDNESTENWNNEMNDLQHYESGSIGEWLQNNACPVEVRNHELLIACLENFERESGMKIKTTQNGFVIPLGPDLKAHLNFTIST